jgi:hypothetical protein
MKKATFLVLIILACFGKAAQSQDTLRLFGHQKNVIHTKKSNYSKTSSSTDIRTLTGPGHKVGFYIGFHTDYSQVGDYDAFGAGGSIAVIANHGLAIGVAGKGFLTEPFESPASLSTKYSYSGGYGGLLIEPILFPKSPIHLSFPVILGAGGISKNVLYNYYYPYEYTQVEVADANAFLVAEPGVELEMNLARWLRFGVGCSYRFTTELEPVVFDTKIMDGLTAGFSLKLGIF